MIRKPRLFTPGPAPLHPRALEAAVGPFPHHRSPAFKARFANVRAGLQRAFRTTGPVAVLTSSGTGGMEAAVVNLLAPGERAAVLAGGKFGRRWADITASYGIDTAALDVEPGAPIVPEEAAEFVAGSQPVAAVFLTASETSTGTAVDVEGIAAAVRRVDPQVAVIVDAISAVGALPIYTDEWELDVVVGGSQKAFMVPPGLAFVAGSPRGWERLGREDTLPRYYLDLRRYAESGRSDQTPFTPAIATFLQVEAALAAVEEVGGIAALERNASSLAAATRAAAVALGLELLAPASPSPAVTAIRAPRPGMAPEIVARLRDDHGAQIAGGQGDLKPDVFRIGHIGYLDELDLFGLLVALEGVLADLEHPVEPGVAVAAARATLAAATVPESG